MLEETAVSSAKIMERMEATLGNLEQDVYKRQAWHLPV